MNDRERGRVEALQRRRSHLVERLERWDPRRDPSRTEHELAAVDWALAVIVVAEGAGLLPTVAFDEAMDRAMRGTAP